MEQKTPVAVFVVGLAIVIVAGLLGLQGNSNVTSGLELMFTSECAVIHRSTISSDISPLVLYNEHSAPSPDYCPRRLAFMLANGRGPLKFALRAQA